MDEYTYFISEVSKIVGVEPHVLRYWEEELELDIPRNSQGKRCYSREDVELLQKVKYWKDKGMQLRAVRELLDHGGHAFETGYSPEQPSTEQPFEQTAGDAEFPVMTVENADTDNPQQKFARILDEIVGRALERNNEKLLGQMSDVLLQELEDRLDAKLEELLRRELARGEWKNAEQEAAAAADKPRRRFWERWRR